MKALFYIWCAMAILGLIASFGNIGHLLFTCFPSAMLAWAMYPEVEKEEDER